MLIYADWELAFLQFQLLIAKAIADVPIYEKS